MLILFITASFIVVFPALSQTVVPKTLNAKSK